jgi:hypothetical protein
LKTLAWSLWKQGECDARKRDLERALNQADPTPKLEIHPNLGELYRRKVNDLETLLQDEDTKPQATDILRSLIQRIEISAGPTRGHAEVRIFGALASILDFALESTNAKATADGGLFRVLMVAGAHSLQCRKTVFLAGGKFITPREKTALLGQYSLT